MTSQRFQSDGFGGDSEVQLDRQVLSIVARIMQVPMDEVSSASSSASIERWDSLQHMKLILAIEEEFGVYFTDDEIIQINDVASIVELVGRKVRG